MTFTTELVWDANLEATAAPLVPSAEGNAFPVGPKTGWLPAHLLTLAAASDFMTALLRLAATTGVRVLGYVSTSQLRIPVDSRTPAAITLTPCIVVASDEEAGSVAALCREATELADVCRMLRGSFEVVPDVRVLDASL